MNLVLSHTGAPGVAFKEMVLHQWYRNSSTIKLSECRFLHIPNPEFQGQHGRFFRVSGWEFLLSGFGAAEKLHLGCTGLGIFLPFLATLHEASAFCICYFSKTQTFRVVIFHHLQHKTFSTRISRKARPHTSRNL